MPRPRIVAVLVLLLPACGLLDGTNGDETDGEPASTGATSTPTGGGPIACVIASDCPSPAPCQQVDCEEDLCVYTPREDGEVVDDVHGDCHALVCDGDGEAAPQTDDSDLPVDGNDCTADLCAGGLPDNPGLPVGTACNGSQVCHADLSCQPCPVRETCSDTSPDEPNETQSQATKLPAVGDDEDAAYLCEVLGSPADVDWFTYTTVDTTLGAVEPAVNASPADPLVCMYFQCQAGGTNVVCPDGTVADAAPLGQQGCCGHGAFFPYVDCKGFNEDATVWLQVRHQTEDPPDCLNYQVGYAY
jgi:hypothetical protein